MICFSINVQFFCRYTDRGIIKYISDCAPNNGYYFIPLYDFGKYVLRITPPQGWIFEPTEVEFNFDGKNDLCSKQTDINFVFKGFTIFGKVFSYNSLAGPKGVHITLRSKANKNVIKQNVTVDDGLYEFHEVLPGQYLIEASHDHWKFLKNTIVVDVVDDNINHRQASEPSDQLCSLGYSVVGKVVSEGRPIRGVQFALFSENHKPPFPLGCQETKPSFLSSLKINSKYHYLCYTLSNEDGQFEFEFLPSGKYIVHSFYDTQNIRFEVVPHQYEFEITNNDKDVGVLFEIGGFSVFGQILNKLNPNDKMENARIQFIDENKRYDDIEVLVKESNGKFSVNNIKTSNYLIKTTLDRYQFDDIKFLISPNSPNIPLITPSKFEICGKIILKNDEFKDENMELLVMEKETKNLIESVNIDNEEFCLFLPGGNYLFQMSTHLKFVQNVVEVVVNKPRSDIVFNQMTITLHGRIQLKSALLEGDDFLSVILSNDKMATKTLPINKLQKKSATDYRFVFENLLPGDYIVSLGGRQVNYFCWKENIIPIELNEKKPVEIIFEQKGYLLQIILSHISDLIIKSPSGYSTKIAKESIAQDRLIKHCVEETGKYSIIPSGCHNFLSSPDSNIIFDTETMSGQMIQLTALQHLVTAKIATTTNITDLQIFINTKSIEGERNKTLHINDGHKVKADVLEYNLKFHENPMSEIYIEPRSSQLIFKPSFYRFRLKDDCHLNGVTFHGRPGIFVNGKISQKISDVKIVIFDNETNQILQTVDTDNEGEYQAGPFDDEINLRIEAMKEDFVFKALPNKKGHFEVSKLSSISTMIVDENGNPLNEVLVSLSGGENNFRRNSFVNTEGKLLFDNLHSGQYFIRFLRKEYDFEPSSKMFDIDNGDNVVIKVVGKKVAFSCIGLVDSLNGEPEADIIVEAVGIRNIVENSTVQCTQLQEQSTSEIDGSFRILGLLPDCQYVIRLKADQLKNKNISKSIPKAHSVRLQNRDLSDLRFIVIYKSLQTDLTVSIQTKEEYLNTISVSIFDLFVFNFYNKIKLLILDQIVPLK